MTIILHPSGSFFYFMRPCFLRRPSSDHVFRILMIGDAGVGKSCLLLRYADDKFSCSTPPTLGVDFRVRKINVDSKVVKLQLWDTAGHERFRTITCSYFRGAHGIILVYDVTNPESFANVKRQWLHEIERHAAPNVSMILVGNKSDLASKRVVSAEEGHALADTLGMPFVETSAKTASGVEDALTTMSAEIMARLARDVQNDHDQQRPRRGLGEGFKLDHTTTTHRRSGCCF